MTEWSSQKKTGEGNGNPLQYFCLGNPMNRELWAAVHGVAESETTEQLSAHTHTHTQMSCTYSFPALQIKA